MGNLCLSKQKKPECKKLVADICGLFKPSSTQGHKNGANAPFFFFELPEHISFQIWGTKEEGPASRALFSSLSHQDT